MLSAWRLCCERSIARLVWSYYYSQKYVSLRSDRTQCACTTSIDCCGRRRRLRHWYMKARSTSKVTGTSHFCSEHEALLVVVSYFIAPHERQRHLYHEI